MPRMNDWQRDAHDAVRREVWSLRGPNQIGPEVGLEEACRRVTPIQSGVPPSPARHNAEANCLGVRPKMRSPRANWGDQVPAESLAMRRQHLPETGLRKST